MIKTAVVILNWNGRELLEKFLPSVTENSLDEHTAVYVADNASSDDSVSFVRTNYPEVGLVILEKNYGFAEGYNRALAQIDAEYFVLLNSDVEVTQGWLKPLINYLDINLDVAVCGPKILDFKDKVRFEYAGAAGGYVDKYGFPFCRGRIFSEVEQDNTQYNDIADCLWVSGCCLVTRANTYREEGGLDKRFFAHMEEIDYCWRLNIKGKKVVNIPESVIYHVGGASLSMGSPKKTFLNYRNSLLCVYKNSAPDKWMRIYIVRLILDTIAAKLFLFKNGWGHFIAVFNGHRAFWQLKKEYESYHKLIDIPKSRYDVKHVFQGSIVKVFYLGKIKTYSKYILRFKTK